MKNLRYLIGLVLVLVVGVGYADPYHFNYTNALLCDPTDTSKGICDLSVKMLGQVFGQVGTGGGVGALAGNGMLAMGWMFRIFNEGICGVIGLFLAYGIFAFGLRSAHDGLQGESKKASLALLRVVLGISLILPQATGYSYMQTIVMETIVAGSGLATTIYQQVLGNMRDGAAELFHKADSASSTTNTKGDNNSFSTLDSKNITKILTTQKTNFIENVFRGEVCTAVSNLYVKQMSSYISYAQSQAAQFTTNYATACSGSGTCNEDKLEAANSAYKKYCSASGIKCTAPTTPAAAQAVQAKLTSYYNTSFPESMGFKGSQMPSAFEAKDNLGNVGHASVSFPGITLNRAGLDKNYDPAQNADVCGSFTMPAPAKKDGQTPPNPSYATDPIREIVESMQPLAANFVNSALGSKLGDSATLANAFSSDQFSPGSLLPVTPLNSKSGDGATISTQITENAIDLAQLMVPYIQQQAAASKGQADSDLTKFVQDSRMLGWVTAGRYYFDMIRLNNYIQNVVAENSPDTASFPSPVFAKDSSKVPSTLLQPFGIECAPDSSGCVDSIAGVAGQALSSDTIATQIGNNNSAGASASKQDSNDANQHSEDHASSTKGWTKKVPCPKMTAGVNGQMVPEYDQHGNVVMTVCSQIVPGHVAKGVGADFQHFWGDNSDLKGMLTGGFSATFAPAAIGYVMMKPLVNAMGNIANFFSGVQDTSPILFVHELGMTILGQTMNALMLTNAVIFVTTLAANICDSQSPLGQATNESINWVGGMLKIMVGPLLLAGGVCAYFVPLYPMLVFTFGVIGWMGAAIESMIAMPLVCLGVTHPDGGHDFMGKGEQAVMLLVGIFIRPSIMIFGMVAAMSVSYVAIRLLNIGFMGTLVDGFGTGMSMVHTNGGALHQAMVVSDATTHMLGNANFGSNHGTVAIDNQFLAGASGGVQSISHAIMAAVNGAKYEHLAGGSTSTSMLAVVTIPSLFIVYTLMVYEVITTCFGMISEFVQAILSWVGGPQMRDNSVQSAKAAQSGFSQVSSKFGDNQGVQVGRNAALTTKQAGKTAYKSAKSIKKNTVG